MAGRGRGRGRKKSPKSNGSNLSRVGVPAVAGVEDSNINNNSHVGRKLMMTTSLDILLRIEATIVLTTRGKGSISIDNFYDMATSHEWLSLNSKGTVNNEKIHTHQQVSKSITEMSTEVYELVSQLSETERLLFDFMTISTCDLRDISTHIYPLYQLNGSRLEILQQPTPKEELLLPARSEVLGTMCHLSRKCYSFDNVVVNTSALQKWWANSKNIAQVILDHRNQTKSIKRDKSKAANGVKSSIVSNSTKSTASSTAHTATTNGEKKMTLEERVRARSLLNPSNTKAKSSKVRESSNQSENKILLELANALRSYSQRRGAASSGCSSALDRLKSRGGDSSNTSASKNIARLTVMDMMKDARVTWSSVVNESVDKHDSSGGNKSRPRGGVGKAVVSIDLSRVLFQIRLKMAPNKDISDKRQMEMQLLDLLEKLSELVPTWIQLRKAPTLTTGSLSSKKRKTSGTNASTTATTATKQQKTNIKQCIIVIRNDAVDYNTDVRIKLGGRSHIATSKNGSKSTVAKGTKRSLEEMKGKKDPTLANVIVPPSFLQTYGKALTEEPKKKKGKK